MSIPSSKTPPMFCNSNILCQEIFSSELSFVQHRKQLLSKLICLEDFITLTDFQFMLLTIDIIHLTRINPSRKKMRQNEKALLLVLISLLSLNRLCRKRAPEHIITVQSSPKPTIFILFLWEILLLTSKCPITSLFFIICASKYATVHFVSNKSKYVFDD